MTNKPKAIGTKAETATVRALQKLGFPEADRRTLTGSEDRGDVLVQKRERAVSSYVIAEVKGGDAARFASDNQILAWLEETEREVDNAGADFGFLVVQRKGVGLANAHRWWAMFYLDYAFEDAPHVVVRTTVEEMAKLIHERL